MTLDNLFEDTNAEYARNKSDDISLAENFKEKRWIGKCEKLKDAVSPDNVIWREITFGGDIEFAKSDAGSRKKYQDYMNLVKRTPELKAQYDELNRAVGLGPTKDIKKVVYKKANKFARDLKRYGKEAGIASTKLHQIYLG